MSKTISTMPHSWEMPSKCHLFPLLSVMVTDVLTSQVQAQAWTRYFPKSILLIITATLSPVYHGICRQSL